VDAMHINLHKTFSTPHGGGGPGAGPVVLSEALAPFAPAPWVVHDDNGYRLIEREEDEAEQAFGRLCAFQGQMGMYVRALSYMMSHGADGLRQVAEDAVLNANYIKARLSDLMSAAFPDGPCMHEALFDDAWLKGTDITTLDFAKAMIDEGFHPMTMYFPLVVHGAMLIEPTETESKAELDRFIHAMRLLAEAAKAGDVDRFKGAQARSDLSLSLTVRWRVECGGHLQEVVSQSGRQIDDDRASALVVPKPGEALAMGLVPGSELGTPGRKDIDRFVVVRRQQRSGALVCGARENHRVALRIGDDANLVMVDAVGP